MKSSETIKDNQATLAITAGYLSTALRLITKEIDGYDDERGNIMTVYSEALGRCFNEKETNGVHRLFKDVKAQADLELELGVEKHMKELRKAIQSDQDATDLLVRLLPKGINKML